MKQTKEKWLTPIGSPVRVKATMDTGIQNVFLQLIDTEKGRMTKAMMLNLNEVKRLCEFINESEKSKEKLGGDLMAREEKDIHRWIIENKLADLYESMDYETRKHYKAKYRHQIEILEEILEING